MLRKLHSYVGIALAPFFVITGIAGGMLLWRKQLWSSGVDVNRIADLHNYEVTGTYFGVIIAAGLVFMGITGLMLFGQVFLRKRRARRKQ